MWENQVTDTPDKKMKFLYLFQRDLRYLRETILLNLIHTNISDNVE